MFCTRIITVTRNSLSALTHLLELWVRLDLFYFLKSYFIIYLVHLLSATWFSTGYAAYSEIGKGQERFIFIGERSWKLAGCIKSDAKLIAILVSRLTCDYQCGLSLMYSRHFRQHLYYTCQFMQMFDYWRFGVKFWIWVIISRDCKWNIFTRVCKLTLIFTCFFDSDQLCCVHILCLYFVHAATNIFLEVNTIFLFKKI